MNSCLSLFLFQGNWESGVNVALVDLFGIEKVAKCYGFMQIGQSMAYFISVPLHGKYINIFIRT